MPYDMDEPMKPKVMDYHKGNDEFSQKYDQAPLNYIERQDHMQKMECKQLKKQAFKGRYSK